MLGVWMNINNPGRALNEDLNLTVGGTIVLTAADVARLKPNELFNVKITVWDEDTFSDDVVYTDQTFFFNVLDTNPAQFHVGVIVPYQKLRASEPGSENFAEIYCNVSARHPSIQGSAVATNGRNSQTEDVII